MKLIKGLFKLILILVIIVIILVGGLLFLIYDSSSVDAKYKEYDKEVDYSINALISNSLKNTKEDDIINFCLGEESANYLLASVFNTIGDTLNSHTNGLANIEGISLKIESSDIMKIKIHASSYFMKTSIEGNLTLKDDTVHDSIYFKINEANIGKISASKALISLVLSKALSEDAIKQELSAKGIEADVSLQDLKIEVKKSEIKNIVLKTFEKDENVGLYTSLVDIIFNNALVEIVASDGELGAKLNVKKLSYDEETMYPLPHDYEDAYLDLKQKEESLLNNSIITYKQASTMFNYLVLGYNKVKKLDDKKENGEEKEYTYIDSLDLTSIGITNNTSYEGILVSPGNTMEDIITSQAPNSIMDVLTYDGSIKINENAMNDILYACGISGMSYAFPRYEDDGWKISYMYIESMYVKILNGEMLLMLTLNLNGKKLGLQAHLNANSNEGLKIVCNVTGINFGEIAFANEDIYYLLDFLNSATSEEKWIKADKDNSQIIFDFSKIFSDNEILSYCIEHSSKTDVTFEGDDTYGQIKIKLTLALLP